MKKSLSLIRVTLATSGLALWLLALPVAHAVDYYWDSNSTTAGFGSTNGTWGTSAFMSTSSAGTDATANTATTTSDVLNIGTSTDGYTGGRTITVSTTQNIGSLVVGSASNAVIVSGGTAINLGGTATITNNSASVLDIQTAITGSSGLVKAGVGSMLLGGSSTFTGDISITGGVLQLQGAPARLGSGNFTGNISIASEASFVDNSPSAQVLSGVISGAGSVRLAGANTLTLTQNNTFTGDTVIIGGFASANMTLNTNLALQNSALDTGSVVSGRLIFGSGVTTPTLGGLKGSVALASVARTSANYNLLTALTLNPGSGFTPSYSGVIANGTTPLTLTKTGLGTQTLSGANSYTGATTIAAGTLSIPTINNAGVNGTLGAGTSAVSLGSSGNTGTLEYTGATASSNRSFTAASGGTGRLNVTNSGATLTFAGLLTADGNLVFDGPGNSTISGNISSLSTGSVTKNGTGSLTLNSPGHAGNFVVNQGTLNVNVNNAFGSATSLTLANGVTLDNTSGSNRSVINTGLAKTLGNALTYTGTGNFSLSLGNGTTALTSNIAVNVANGTLEFAGDMTGSGFGITKTGIGRLLISGLTANTSFTGNSTISQGELFLDGTSTLAGGASTFVTIDTGATLRVGGTASLGGVTINQASGANLILLSLENADRNFTGNRTLTANDALVNGIQTIEAGVVITSDADWIGSIPGSPTAGRIVMENGATLRSTLAIDINANKGIELSGASATFSTANGTIFINSVVAGPGKLIKTGTAGFRILNTSNTYAGGTDIMEGTFGIFGDGSLGLDGTDVFINNGATLNSAQETGNMTVTVSGNRSIFLANGGTSNIDARTTSTFVINSVIDEQNVGADANLQINTLGAREGIVVLAGTNTYNGSTTVNAGTLWVNGDNSAATGAVTVANTATLGGTGTIGGDTTIQSGGTLSPGNSPGTMTFSNADLIFNDGGNFNWQIVDANGVAGTGYDTNSVTGTGILDLSALTGTTDFNINLWSLQSIGPDVNGNATNFNNALNYTWTLVSTPTAISGFDASDFTINVGAINGTSGFSNTTNGTFSVALADSNTDLVLVYTAVPEPATFVILAGGIIGLVALRRRMQA